VALAVVVSLACARAPLPPSASLVAAVAGAAALVVLYVAAGIALGAIRRRDFDLIRSVVAGTVPEGVSS
jgi:hypothetical protein